MNIGIVLCALGSWACVIATAVFYDLKAAALILLAVLFEAICASIQIVQAEQERLQEYEEVIEHLKEVKEKLKTLEDDLR